MVEARTAKWIAIALGVVEFLFGLALALVIVIQQSWLDADPATVRPAWWWPMIWVFAVCVIIGPPAIAYIAERSASRRVVMICIGILVAYPLCLFAAALIT
ncbi:hypothetical protein J4558_23505 [Leptolyngbya sp. 15MV]|nr:hypothetical protein J4558_23505 [Leptolyngbya sp. 15MV]